MAIPKIKATYALDSETIRLLERLANRWNVSKSEALRRAIRTAAADARPATQASLGTLDDLQRSVGMTTRRAGRWARAIRAERRASSTRDDVDEK
jgi:hypothetical protein